MILRKKLIAGNWKMNKTPADGVALAKELVAAAGKQADVEVVVCPPFTALDGVGKALEGSLLKLGAQNMHFEASGAFTGEISGGMLRDAGATDVIIGGPNYQLAYLDLPTDPKTKLPPAELKLHVNLEALLRL